MHSQGPQGSGAHAHSQQHGGAHEQGHWWCSTWCTWCTQQSWWWQQHGWQQHPHGEQQHGWQQQQQPQQLLFPWPLFLPSLLLFVPQFPAPQQHPHPPPQSLLLLFSFFLLSSCWSSCKGLVTSWACWGADSTFCVVSRVGWVSCSAVWGCWFSCSDNWWTWWTSSFVCRSLITPFCCGNISPSLAPWWVWSPYPGFIFNSPFFRDKSDFNCFPLLCWVDWGGSKVWVGETAFFDIGAPSRMTDASESFLLPVGLSCCLRP